MLPEFDEDGNLPPGVYKCSLQEVEARFGQGSPERHVETAELADFVSWARQAGVTRLLVDGSYVTSKVSPNDVDVVILPGAGYPQLAGPVSAVVNRWPFVHVMVAADEADLEQWARVDFGIDRQERHRGIVEIDL
jgi:hypothetical protein